MTETARGRPKVLFPAKADEDDFEDMPSVGHSGVDVLLPDGRKISLDFVDLNKLGRILEAAKRMGKPCIVFRDLNVIALTEVTKENIEAAVDLYFDAGFFDQFK